MGIFLPHQCVKASRQRSGESQGRWKGTPACSVGLFVLRTSCPVTAVHSSEPYFIFIYIRCVSELEQWSRKLLSRAEISNVKKKKASSPLIVAICHKEVCLLSTASQKEILKGFIRFFSLVKNKQTKKTSLGWIRLWVFCLVFAMISLCKCLLEIVLQDNRLAEF